MVLALAFTLSLSPTPALTFTLAGVFVRNLVVMLIRLISIEFNRNSIADIYRDIARQVYAESPVASFEPEVRSTSRCVIDLLIGVIVILMLLAKAMCRRMIGRSAMGLA